MHRTNGLKCKVFVKKTDWILIVFLISGISAHCRADRLSLGLLKNFGLFGGGNSAQDTRLSSARGDSGSEIEGLYQFGLDKGFLIGFTNGRRVEGYKQKVSASRPANDFESVFRYNGIKAGFWVEESSGFGAQGLLTYGKGKFDFYVIDETTPEVTTEPNFAEVELRSYYKFFNSRNFGLQFYGGIRMNKIFVDDFIYNGVSYQKSEVSGWDTLFLMYGVGLSY